MSRSRVLADLYSEDVGDEYEYSTDDLTATLSVNMDPAIGERAADKEGVALVFVPPQESKWAVFVDATRQTVQADSSEVDDSTHIMTDRDEFTHTIRQLRKESRKNCKTPYERPSRVTSGHLDAAFPSPSAPQASRPSMVYSTTESEWTTGNSANSSSNRAELDGGTAQSIAAPVASNAIGGKWSRFL